MDDITHALAGTLLARAHPSKKRGLVLACVFGSLVPDIDIVLTLGGRGLYVTEHRGFTHSLLGLLPMSLLAAAAAFLFLKRVPDRASFRAIWAMALTGVVSHILLDWCTSWGTMILWPDRRRFSLDTLFIIDLWYGALLAFPLAASAFYKKHRVPICALGIGLVLGYHCLTAWNHSRAMKIAAEDRPGAWRAAFPQPFSPFRWSAFNRADGVLKNAGIDFWKSPRPLEWKQWKEPMMTPAIREVMDSPQGKQYLWFARVPLWEEENQPDGTVLVHFWDLRFNARWRKDQPAPRFGMNFIVKDGRVSGGGF